MRGTRRARAAFFTLLALVVLLALSYGTRSGRRAVREASRVVRLARNATQISPLPVLTLRIWTEGEGTAVRVQVYESGRLVISARERTEHTLPKDATMRLVELGQAALGDFNNEGCNVPGGKRNADLYLMIDGEWRGSVCRSSKDWPRAAEMLLDEIGRQLPKAIGLPVEF